MAKGKKAKGGNGAARPVSGKSASTKTASAKSAPGKAGARAAAKEDKSLSSKDYDEAN